MSDREIIDLFLSRDRSAVEEAAKAYGESCRAIAERILGDPGEAEECVNDTMMRAWESIPPAEPERLGTYLFSATRNIALNRLERQSAAKRGGGETALVFEEISEIVSGEYDPETELIKKELANEIVRFLHALPDEHRKVFVERYWYCASIGEIAEHTGVNKGTINSILSRTRKKLLNYLRKEGYEV